MYLTKLIEGENRILVQCNMHRGRYVKFSAVYDTGAELSCITANSISTELTESEFSDAEVRTVGGLVDSENLYIKYYKMPIKDFYLGNIHIACVDLWVTFDDRVTDCVIGLDVLTRVTRLHIAYTDEEIFFKDTDELKNYILTVGGSKGESNK